MVEFDDPSIPARPLLRPFCPAGSRALTSETGLVVATFRDEGLTVTVLKRVLDLAGSRTGSTVVLFSCPLAADTVDWDISDRKAGPADRIGNRKDEDTGEDAMEV